MTSNESQFICLVSKVIKQMFNRTETKTKIKKLKKQK